MAQVNTKDFSTLPVGRLGLIPLQSCSSLGAKVNDWLVKWRAERQYPGMDSFAFEGYKRDSYIIDAKTPRFGSGEGKCTINESVRGDDIYVMVDVTNYSLSYPIGPYTNLMSPDDHFQDMKRVIAAVGGKARRVNVIMPYLYESRQDKRVGRESLDCANALHELIDMGVENIITFDAHYGCCYPYGLDPRAFFRRSSFYQYRDRYLCDPAPGILSFRNVSGCGSLPRVLCNAFPVVYLQGSRRI